MMNMISSQSKWYQVNIPSGSVQINLVGEKYKWNSLSHTDDFMLVDTFSNVTMNLIIDMHYVMCKCFSSIFLSLNLINKIYHM